MSNIELKGKLFLIAGPSGVGKSVLINLLKERHPEFVFPLTATTRTPRLGEVDGVNYYFLTREDFERRLGAGEFLEHAFVHGENYYGVLRDKIVPFLEEGKTVIREVDIQGVRTLHQVFGGGHLTSIFLLPPPREVLIKRIRERAPIAEEDLEKRMESLEREMQGREACEYQMEFSPNGTIEENYAKLEALILKLSSRAE